MISIEKVSKFCKDYTKIENYEEAVNDKSQVWVCHHILGEILTSEQLKDHDFYYDVPPCMLKFVTRAEHARLHRKGKSWTEDTRIKISEAKKGITFTDEHRRKLAEANKGKIPWNKCKKCKPITEEHARKMHEAWKGKHHTEESRRKMSEALKGKSAWNKGKHLSEEHRKKLSEARQNISEESRRKMSEAAKNRAQISDDTRRKQSESHKGLRWKLIDGIRVYYRNEEDTSLG